ncbi:MAG: hypothetical protein GY778_03715 [bacterium]|nr:hypothetical protein [bacterium]
MTSATEPNQTEIDGHAPARPKGNKAMLAILLIIAVGLLAWVVFFQPDDASVPVVKVEQDRGPAPFDREPEGGVLTDEPPEFDVEVIAKRVRNQQRLEFVITEVHGWAVQRIKVEAEIGDFDPETGDFVPFVDYTVKMLCREIVDFGQTLVCETTLNNAELELIGGDILGSDNWRGRVYSWTNVYHPE